MVKIIIITILLFLIASSSYAYTYKVRPGDTLSEITLMFTGNLHYKRIAKANSIENPDIIKSGKRIRIKTNNPISVLERYLEAIYGSNTAKAYELLSTHNKANLTIEEFEKAIQERTEFEMSSFKVVSDASWDNKLVLFIEGRLEDDPARWGFNLLREKGRWRVLLLNHIPTFPQNLIGVPANNEP